MLEVVGRYRIQERIGEGAMADVYRAHDPSINRSLAIKVLKAEFRQNKEYSSRFLREAKAAGALSHPNIVRIYDVGEIEGYPFIVMELLEGEPLNDVLQREGKLPADQVMTIGIQLAEALRYAHSLGVVHRDIKPSNIILDPKDHSIKILDFGIARIAEGDGLLDAENLKTQVGQVLGTPRYMSPEQALGAELDGRSDLFSVGVVLYEALTGKRAFAGSSAATLALQITQQDPEPIATAAPETPRGVQFIFSKLLAKKPERRFADGGQLAAALRRELAVYEAVMAESAAKRTYLPLHVRITLMLAAVTSLVLAGSIGTVLVRQYAAMERMAITSGSAVASFVANNVALSAAENATLPPAERDWLPVQAFVRVAAEDPNVSAMSVIDADGVVRAANDPAQLGRRYAPPAGEKAVAADGALRVTEAVAPDGRAFRFVRPITYAGRQVGRVDLSLDKRELEAAAGLSRTLLILLGVVTLATVGVATYAVTRMLNAPIGRLKAALNQAATGDLNFRISHHRKDEFGELFEAFNRLAGAVQERAESAESVTDTALGSARPPAGADGGLAGGSVGLASGPFARPSPQAAMIEAPASAADPLPPMAEPNALDGPAVGEPGGVDRDADAPATADDLTGDGDPSAAAAHSAGPDDLDEAPPGPPADADRTLISLPDDGPAGRRGTS